MKIIQVGTGGWAAGWLEFIHQTEGCELVGLVSRGGEGLKAAQQKWGIEDSRCYGDLADALKLEADFVLVSVPHPWHVAMVKQAVAGGKNVLCEKPLCDDLDEAKALLAWLKGREQKVWVSQNFRFREPFWQMRASLGAGAGQIGTPQWADVLFRVGTTAEKYGPETEWQRKAWRVNQTSLLAVECSIHHFDMMRFLAGSNAKWVNTLGWCPEWSAVGGVETMFCQIEFDSGFRVNYSGSMKGIGFETGYQANWSLQTDRTTVRWEYDGAPQLAEVPGGPAQLAQQSGFPGFDRFGVLAEMKKALAGQPSAVPTVQDNIESFAISFAALESAQRGGRVYLDDLLK